MDEVQAVALLRLAIGIRVAAARFAVPGSCEHAATRSTTRPGMLVGVLERELPEAARKARSHHEAQRPLVLLVELRETCNRERPPTPERHGVVVRFFALVPVRRDVDE